MAPRSLSVPVLLALAFVTFGCGGGDSPTGSSPTPTPSPSAVVPTPSATPAAWIPVFTDEFDTDGSPDPAKWSYEIGSLRNNEAQYYTSRRENVRVEKGKLVIEARKEEYEGFHYTSASINTRHRFEFRYGRIEVRAKIPTGKGTWPAIWMLGTNIDQVGWPACGEIDIMENVGYDPNNIVATVHTTDYNHTIGTQRSSTVAVPDPWADYHVFATEWYPDRIDTFIDGRKFFTFQNNGTGVRAWPFDANLYLLINLAIGGSWGGLQGIDDTRFPHTYSIDYVRIFKGSN